MISWQPHCQAIATKTHTVAREREKMSSQLQPLDSGNERKDVSEKEKETSLTIETGDGVKYRLSLNAIKNSKCEFLKAICRNPCRENEEKYVRIDELSEDFVIIHRLLLYGVKILERYAVPREESSVSRDEIDRAKRLVRNLIFFQFPQGLAETVEKWIKRNTPRIISPIKDFVRVQTSDGTAYIISKKVCTFVY